MEETEKEKLAKVCGDLMVTVLWDPRKVEAHCETAHHDVRVRREGDHAVGIIRGK